MTDENKYDEVATPEPAEQPENPLGEATDPAAVVGNAVTDATPVQSSDPDPANAAEPVDGSVDAVYHAQDLSDGVAIAAPIEQETDQN